MSDEKKMRNYRMVEEYRSGETFRAIAAKYGISEVRARMIIARDFHKATKPLYGELKGRKEWKRRMTDF